MGANITPFYDDKGNYFLFVIVCIQLKIKAICYIHMIYKIVCSLCLIN